MEQRDPAQPPAPLYGDDPGLDEGYNQDPGYGHNQEQFLLHHPQEDADASEKEPPHRERRRRVSGIGLGSAGAAGIPDADGHTHTGFGDPDRD